MAEQVGKYLLLKKLATGGMAEIHLAEQSGPGGFKKQLVIKRILPHLLGDEKFLQMFQDEARVAAVMNHPNIVQIFELGQHDDNYFIAMEYVNGFNLRSVIQTCSENGLWLAPEYIAKIASQICEGLEYAHSFCDSDGHHLNLIHRDVSPQNIILSFQGIIKIVDFGIAKAQSTQETQAGTIKGKLAYMSPEQVKGLVLDRRSDIFSLGIVMYELATYNRPFHGKSDIDMLRAILNAGPVPIQQYRPDFPEEFSAIVNRALAKNRDERYQSARELQWDIERFIQNWRKPIGPFQLQ
ncbi:serine/threonine protein kinase, partial [Myxococcota bacterium]|nr:serine/threonine protein kinase [Myxococcota bacterium]